VVGELRQAERVNASTWGRRKARFRAPNRQGGLFVQAAILMDAVHDAVFLRHGASTQGCALIVCMHAVMKAPKGAGLARCPFQVRA
jgi:hypothetical protein